MPPSGPHRLWLMLKYYTLFYTTEFSFDQGAGNKTLINWTRTMNVVFSIENLSFMLLQLQWLYRYKHTIFMCPFSYVTLHVFIGFCAAHEPYACKCCYGAVYACKISDAKCVVLHKHCIFTYCLSCKFTRNMLFVGEYKAFRKCFF